MIAPSSPHPQMAQGYPITIHINGDIYIFGTTDLNYIHNIMKNICKNSGLNQTTLPTSYDYIHNNVRIRKKARKKIK